MSKYVVLYKLEKRKGMTSDLVIKHVEHIRNLSQKKVLLLCGLLKGKGGGALLIIEAETKKEAEKYILQDPLVVLKNYSFVINEFIEANEGNNFLL
jgi:uncharacterized protein YciI